MAVPQSDLDDLHERFVRTRWPRHETPGLDQSTMRELTGR
ncbi:hypothetical protein [Actinoplanes sp. CA-252034]